MFWCPYIDCLIINNLIVCNVDLQNKPYFVLSGKLVCYNDIKSTCCYACQALIEGDRIITQFGNFHKDCCKCFKCGYVNMNNFNMRKKIEDYVKDSCVPIPKHFNEELRMRLAGTNLLSTKLDNATHYLEISAQFKAVERHVITSSHSESAAHEMSDEEEVMNPNDLKLEERQKKWLQAAGAEASSPPAKSKRSKKLPVFTHSPPHDNTWTPLKKADLFPKSGLNLPHLSSYSTQGFSKVEMSDRTSISKYPALSKSRALSGSALSSRRDVSKSPPLSSPPSPSRNNNQEPLHELKSLSSKREPESTPGSSKPTSGKTNVNALVMVYEEITARATDDLSPDASTADHNSPESQEEKSDSNRTMFCETRLTSKLPVQAIPDCTLQNPTMPQMGVLKIRKADESIKQADGTTTRFRGALLALLLSIVVAPISILLYLRNWVATPTPEEPINLQSLGIEMINYATQTRTSN
ncbi:unnamed protein product [Hydatigera taeniaeformis]|uniref:LIM zinc-binding domain-containing protein n=1 Tax=Hydatigena taeniaeformis TaxID=6205 RepID=A0A0R3X592_HYDTA|nr:unnamed protein product [Hydatigera taeniaeformis]